jgi:hypothetical protein
LASAADCTPEQLQIEPRLKLAPVGCAPALAAGDEFDGLELELDPEPQAAIVAAAAAASAAAPSLVLMCGTGSSLDL